MKSRAALPAILLLFLMIPFKGMAQQCTPVSKANDITPDQLCSPVEVVTWEVSYAGVDASVTNVDIYFDWDDGVTETFSATETAGRVFTATRSHTYVSMDEKCNFRPTATMIVDGIMCTSQWQEQIVTIWDVDNKNGAYVSASPDVYPVCVGNSATMRFDDDTRYNCVPPQEEDNRNESTRWIQWVYGTSNDMTGNPVSVDGYTGPWPYTTPVKTLPGPSWGSSEKSLPIFVDDDKVIGEEFEVELRYWNYCNKYTDGKDPVIDSSVIRIVGLPDPTINPVGQLCEFGGNVTLTAATPGGTWSGTGISNDTAGIFSPSLAGQGTHLIHYEVSDDNSCSAEDDISIEVIASPNGTITPIDPVCLGDAPFNMTAATNPGTWSGSAGITNTTAGTFSPAVAGIGSHVVSYKTATDISGCFGVDTSIVHVVAPPYAAFLTPDSAWCQRETNSTMASIIFTGLDSTTFELVYEARGITDTLFNISADTFDLFLNNLPGENLYILKKVIEHHGANSCETPLFDTLSMQVNGNPVAAINMDYDDLCSPVEVEFSSDDGYKLYTWDFGNGPIESSSNAINRTLIYEYKNITTINGTDTIIGLSDDDSTFLFSLRVETFDGCVDTIFDSIEVYPVPTAYFYVYPDVQSHPDSVVYLSNLTSVGNWNYQWDFGDEKTDTEKEPIEHVYYSHGNYDIRLRSFSEHCWDTISRRVQILPPSPMAFFYPDTSGCPPLRVQFTNTSLYADTYIWDFDDGKFSSEPNPDHLFFDNREHKVTMAAYGLSGSDTATHTVFVYTPPQAIFEAYPKESRNLKQTFKFTNHSVNSSYFLWDFGDGNTSADFEPSHIYEDSGQYSVTLYAWSEQNCADTVVHEDLIRVMAGEGTVDFPTVFAWNGSGPSGGHWQEGEIDNTVFHPAVVNVKIFKMVIYTRWGEQIFESNDLYIGWDGYMKNGILATEGVYLWKAWVTYVDSMEDILVGDITFLH